jgi:hypothetical protein
VRLRGTVGLLLRLLVLVLVLVLRLRGCLVGATKDGRHWQHRPRGREHHTKMRGLLRDKPRCSGGRLGDEASKVLLLLLLLLLLLQ